MNLKFWKKKKEEPKKPRTWIIHGEEALQIARLYDDFKKENGAWAKVKMWQLIVSLKPETANVRCRPTFPGNIVEIVEVLEDD